MRRLHLAVAALALIAGSESVFAATTNTPAPSTMASVSAQPCTSFFCNAFGGQNDARPAASAPKRETVAYTGPYSPGTIIISTEERRLYLVLPNGQALRYGVGVGRPGFSWGGTKTITAKREWPSWTPPSQMLRRRPDLPHFMPGGPDNPLGARAMYLGSSLYRIHGSNEPETIGQAVSSGCIRMTNEDVQDLYERVRIGTRVIVQR